jgi:hypothetical protein
MIYVFVSTRWNPVADPAWPKKFGIRRDLHPDKQQHLYALAYMKTGGSREGKSWHNDRVCWALFHPFSCHVICILNNPFPLSIKHNRFFDDSPSKIREMRDQNKDDMLLCPRTDAAQLALPALDHSAVRPPHLCREFFRAGDVVCENCSTCRLRCPLFCSQSAFEGRRSGPQSTQGGNGHFLAYNPSL